MTHSETGTIRATFDNGSDQEIQPYYEVEISGALARKFENQLTVPARESKTVEWTVDANDIDLDSFIFVQMVILPDGTYRTRQAICGVFVLNIPGATGESIFIFALFLSLTAITAGHIMQENLPDTDPNGRRSTRALGIAVLLAMLAAFMGWWLAGIVFCTIVILLLFISLRYIAG